jgi:hydrogenase maturation factor
MIMNLLYAEVSQIFVEDGLRMGKIRVGGALKTVALELLADAAPGDTILLCDGVAISKVAKEPRKESNHVPGNPR